MVETVKNGSDFIGYEYKDVIISREMEALYADGYANFGWKLENTYPVPLIGINLVVMKFKRDRKIRNKAELTRLQRQFDSCVREIQDMEKSKTVSASIAAYTIGLTGIVFLAGSLLAYLKSIISLCVVLAIPGFIGFILPYFAYQSLYAKKSIKVTSLIEGKYDEIYEVCEKADSLL